MKFKLTFLLITLSFYPFTSLLAQRDFRPGYIILPNNDTLQGYIHYGSSRINSQKCTFRPNEEAESKSYSPRDIQAYRFTDDKYYVSKLVSLDSVSQYLFLEYLVNGVVDLYYYYNKNDYYFIDQGDGILRELKNEDVEFTTNTGTYTKKSNEYKGSLKALFMNAPEIVEQVDHTKLNHNALIEITQDYHAAVCTDEECLVYQKEKTKGQHRIGLVAGINNFNFATAPDNNSFIADVPYGRHLFPSLGIYYSVNFPNVNERLHFHYELTYTHVKMTTPVTFAYEYVAGYAYTITKYKTVEEVEFEQQTINNAALLNYILGKGAIQPSLQLGGFVNCFLSTSFPTVVIGGNIYDKDWFNPIVLGLSIGVGVQFPYTKTRDMAINLRYNRGFLYGPRLNSSIFSANICLQLNKNKEQAESRP